MKNLLTLLAAVLVVSSLNAQEVRKLRFGLAGSASTNWFNPTTKGIESNGLRLGFSYGLLADFALMGSNNYALATGIKITDIGGKLAYPDALEINGLWTTGNTEAIYKLRYIDIPLSLKLKTNEIGYLTYFANFGFNSGILIKSQQKFETSNIPSIGTRLVDWEDAGDNFRLFRTSLLIGGGTEYNLSGNTYITAGIFYHNGFTNVLKGDYYEIDTDNKVVFDNAGNLNQTPRTGVKRKSSLHMVELVVSVMF